MPVNCFPTCVAFVNLAYVKIKCSERFLLKQRPGEGSPVRDYSGDLRLPGGAGLRQRDRESEGGGQAEVQGPGAQNAVGRVRNALTSQPCERLA